MRQIFQGKNIPLWKTENLSALCISNVKLRGNLLGQALRVMFAQQTRNDWPSKLSSGGAQRRNVLERLVRQYQIFQYE